VDYFEIDIDWDKTHDSPWDALFDDGELEGFDCLDGSIPLARIWKPPSIKLWKGRLRPDIYDFQLHWAVTERVRARLAPIVRDEAEFLPLIVPKAGPLYVIHPLWPVDFDRGAKFSCNPVSKNITDVTKYSFTLDPKEFDGPRHLFRMRQAKGSAARDHGYTCGRLIVSEKIKRTVEKNGLVGVMFNKVFSTKDNKRS
jgi:hypothetical protein